MVQSVINQRLHTLVLLLMRMYFCGVHLVLGLMFLPVEEALHVAEGIVCLALVEFALHFAFAGTVDALVVDDELSCARVAGRLHADVIAFIIDFHQMSQEQINPIPDILVRDLLRALLTLHTRHCCVLLVPSLIHSRELDELAARGVRARHGEPSNRSVFQTLLCLRLEDGVG